MNLQSDWFGRVPCSNPTGLCDRQEYARLNSDLQTAWREWKNDDIAADIISFVRRLALGDPLIGHEDRIRRAIKKVNALRPWTKMQQQWLERIERQLLKESVIERADFDRGAFRDHGGFSRIDGVFQGRLQEVLDMRSQFATTCA